MNGHPAICVENDGPISTIIIARPEKRNAVDGPMARALLSAFTAFEADEALRVAVLYGEGGTFSAGADLSALADSERRHHLDPGGEPPGPMGPTRMALQKPVIAAVAGHAVAGGLELALLADLRVVEETAVFGVFCRRFGVPLIDLGTIRLPRLIGQSQELDLILTGRGVSGEEALRMGLANRLVKSGRALESALELARMLAGFPQMCMRSDRLSCYEQWGLSTEEAMRNEYRRGLAVLASGETAAGALKFAAGAGRHGRSR